MGGRARRLDDHRLTPKPAAERAAGTDAAFLVTDTTTGERLGAAGVHRLGAEVEPCSATLPSEIGYWLAPARHDDPRRHGEPLHRYLRRREPT